MGYGSKRKVVQGPLRMTPSNSMTSFSIETFEGCLDIFMGNKYEL